MNDLNALHFESEAFDILSEIVMNHIAKKENYTQMSDELKQDCCEEPDVIIEDGFSSCRNCGDSQRNFELVLSLKKESMLYFRKNLDYDRVRYWNEYVSYLEGKVEKYFDIPSNIVELLMENMKIIYTKITYQTVYAIMKKNKINKYTKHIPYFCNQHLHIDFPKFTSNQKIIFDHHFKDLLSKFMLLNSKNRKNFFSFGFLINKFVQDEKLEFFNVSIKSRKEQEELYLKCV